MEISKLLFSLSLFFVVNSNCSEKDEYLFAHGFGGNKNQVKAYQHYKIIPQHAQAHNGPEAPIEFPMPNLSKTVFAQEDDVQVLTNAIQSSKNQIIGVGVSKGAATWINAAAKDENINNIKALVLESPFASANEMIFKVTHLEYIPGHKYIAKFIGKFIIPNYNFEGIQPITSISKISNKELPIFIIHSKKDLLIPINHSRILYKEFINHGFTNVYLIETENGDHANILGSQDTKTFQNSVDIFKDDHTFLTQCSIPQINQLIAKDHNYKPEISRFIIKTLLTCYVVYKAFKYFPSVKTQLSNYMNKLL